MKNLHPEHTLLCPANPNLFDSGSTEIPFPSDLTHFYWIQIIYWEKISSNIPFGSKTWWLGSSYPKIYQLNTTYPYWLQVFWNNAYCIQLVCKQFLLHPRLFTETYQKYFFWVQFIQKQLQDKTIPNKPKAFQVIPIKSSSSQIINTNSNLFQMKSTSS